MPAKDADPEIALVLTPEPDIEDITATVFLDAAKMRRAEAKSGDPS